MTIQDAIFESLLRLQQQEVTVSVSRPTVLLYMNEALQYVYRIAKSCDYTFFTRSHAFSGTSVTYEDHFSAMIYVYVPDATDGQAVHTSNRQYVGYNLNQYSTGTTACPNYRLFADHFEITPSSDGIYYYMFTFGTILDQTQEITELIPWIFEELVILKTVELLMQRHFMMASPKLDELQTNIENKKRGYIALFRQWLPSQTYKEEQPGPALLPNDKSSQNQ